ncbi:MAG: hypothetical protein Q6370_019695 [Candidatus Sigynarchaeota archaeon]
MHVEPHGARARAGWKRAARAESAVRSDSRYGLSGLESVLRARRKACSGAGTGNDKLGRASGIAAATWQHRDDDPAPMEVASIHLLIWKGCGGHESVAARGTEPAAGIARAKASGGRWCSPSARLTGRAGCPTWPRRQRSRGHVLR